MKELKDLSTEELLDAYKQVNDFLKYLEIEENNLEN